MKGFYNSLFRMTDQPGRAFVTVHLRLLGGIGLQEDTNSVIEPDFDLGLLTPVNLEQLLE